jgi:hypothetical protein
MSTMLSTGARTSRRRENHGKHGYQGVPRSRFYVRTYSVNPWRAGLSDPDPHDLPSDVPSSRIGHLRNCRSCGRNRGESAFRGLHRTSRNVRFAAGDLRVHPVVASLRRRGQEPCFEPSRAPDPLADRRNMQQQGLLSATRRPWNPRGAPASLRSGNPVLRAGASREGMTYAERPPGPSPFRSPGTVPANVDKPPIPAGAPRSTPSRPSSLRRSPGP